MVEVRDEHRARPQERHPLPGGGVFVVVPIESGVGGDQQPLLAGGTQARVDIVEAPFVEQRAQGADEPLREPGEPLLVVHAFVRGPRVRVEKDQVESDP